MTVDDVIERARSKVANLDEAMKDMADEITSLRSQNKVMREAVVRIHILAMTRALSARVPECGDFGVIAQDADWILSKLDALSPTSKDESP